MSTDWIKMRVDLRTHPKVVRMSSALKADRLRVVGGLHAVWSIFDAHSTDGFLDGYSFWAIDDELGWKGFAQAMANIGWLEDAGGNGLTAPRFDEHNGQSAKRRATENERKRVEREADKKRKKVGQMSAPDADKLRAREEKRREEEKENPPAARVPPEPSARSTTTRGSRIPPDWTPGDDGMAFAEQFGLRNGRASAELARFRDYWAAQPGQKGVKTDWPATWRNWCRRTADGAKEPSIVSETPRQRAAREEAELWSPSVARRAPGTRTETATEVIDVTAKRLD